MIVHSPQGASVCFLPLTVNRGLLYKAAVLLFLSTMLLASATFAADLVVSVRETIDGDTILLDDGRKVRYLGINAPEVGQPFAREATNFNRRLVSGLSVHLELDQVTADRYGRLLAYVYHQGKMVNEQLLAEGWAHIFSIPPNTRYEIGRAHV